MKTVKKSSLLLVGFLSFTISGLGLLPLSVTRTNVEELNAVANIHNIPSIKVIQKCGFDFVNIMEHDNDVLIVTVK